jgi:carbon starvation protein CstA
VFTLSAMALAIGIIVYGFLASALPVWLLLAPRDYLSTFVKLGRGRDAGGRHPDRAPELQLPAFTRFRRRHRPDLRRQNLPVLLHHHRLRRGLGIPLR